MKEKISEVVGEEEARMEGQEAPNFADDPAVAHISVQELKSKSDEAVIKQSKVETVDKKGSAKVKKEIVKKVEQPG